MAASVRNYIHRVFYSNGITPLPYATVVLCSLSVLINVMTNTMCMSYLPKMVKSFGVSEIQTGQCVGFIASSIYVGMVTCSLLWGHLADTKGHKLVLVIALVGMTIATLLFSFTTSITWALLSRLLQGFFTGSYTVGRSVLSHTLDETNAPLGFSIYFTCRTIAFIIGPTLAGYLVFPVEQYPHVFSKESLFSKYSIMLPNFFLVVSDAILIILIIFFLPNDKRKSDELPKDEISLIQVGASNIEHTEGNSEEQDHYDFSSNSNKDFSNTIAATQPELSTKLLQLPIGLLKTLKLFKSKDFPVCLVIWCLLGFCVVGVEDIFPLFAATNVQYNGLGLTPPQIGTIFLASACVMLVVQLTITSRITKHFGPRNTLIASTLLLTFTVPLVPAIRPVTKDTPMYLAICLLSCNQVGINASLICINILLNKCVTTDTYGLASGIGLTATALGRLAAPSIYGSFYSWSLSNVQNVAGNDNAFGFPFNQFFVFFLASLTCLFISVLTTCLSDTSDTPMTAERNSGDEKKERDASPKIETGK